MEQNLNSLLALLQRIADNVDIATADIVQELPNYEENKTPHFMLNGIYHELAQAKWNAVHYAERLKADAELEQQVREYHRRAAEAEQC